MAKTDPDRARYRCASWRKSRTAMYGGDSIASIADRDNANG
jgi:hypothetical protein